MNLDEIEFNSHFDALEMHLKWQIQRKDMQ